MKKIFALALAAVMTAGMTTVAFAEAPVDFVNSDSNKYYAIDSNDDGVYEVASIDAMAENVFDGEEKIALFVFDKDNKHVKDDEDLNRYKISADWTVGKVAEKPKFEMVKIENHGYVYAVTFVLPEGEATKTKDLTGTITIHKSTGDKDKADNKFEIGLEYGYDAAYEVKGDDDLSEKKAVKFDCDDVAVLTFGDMEFEVDLTGQGKLNVKNNTDFNKEFAAMYDYANVDFINFEYEPSFNKTGIAYIYADEDAFIYEVTEDGAKAIKGLKWDEDYEAWTFKTRTLKSYAISDVELDEKTVTEDKNESSKPAGDKENPDTGR